MPISTLQQTPSHPSLVKMEDRKRSAGDDLAPPTKRQAVNGKASADTDMPWATDLEVCRCRLHGFTTLQPAWVFSESMPPTCTGLPLLIHYMSGGDRSLWPVLMRSLLSTACCLACRPCPSAPYNTSYSYPTHTHVSSSRSDAHHKLGVHADTCRTLALPERCDLAPDAGIQAGKEHT